MIADGSGIRDMQYITCDDYDGKNTPKRSKLDLKSYWNKVSSGGVALYVIFKCVF